MIKLKNFFFAFLLSIYFVCSASAEINIRKSGGIFYVQNATVKETEELFSKYGYTRFHSLKDLKYPAIFLKTLPIDFNQITSLKYRNELFVRILTPLALKINEELHNERQTLLRIDRAYQENGSLTEQENQKLEEFAIKYDVFTRHKGDDRILHLLTNLKLRINIIPPSILVAVAAMETNWGFSRVAQVANSLYKEKVWHTDEGLIPEETPEDGYRFKIFESLLESMRSFALTFNSHINYENVWTARDNTIKRRGFSIGESIAYTLSISSNLPNYAGILDYTTAFYNFLILDMGQLNRGFEKNDN